MLEIQIKTNIVLFPTTPSLKKITPSCANEEQTKSIGKNVTKKNQLTSIMFQSL
jgi:hypothetical protein